MEQIAEAIAEDIRESPSSPQESSTASSLSPLASANYDQKPKCEAELEECDDESATSSDHEYGEIPLADDSEPSSTMNRSSKLPLGQHKVMTRRSVGTIVVDSSEFATTANPDHHNHKRASGSSRKEDNNNKRRGRSERPQDAKKRDESRSLSRGSRSLSQGSRSLSRSARKRTSLYVKPAIRRDPSGDAKPRSGEFSLKDHHLHHQRPKRSGTKKRRSSMEMNTVSKMEDFLPKIKEPESFKKDDFEKNMASGSSSKDRVLSIPRRQISARQLSGVSSASSEKDVDSPDRLPSTPETEAPNDHWPPLSPSPYSSLSPAKSPQRASPSQDVDLTPKMRTSRRIAASPTLPSVSSTDDDPSAEITPVASNTPSRKQNSDTSPGLPMVSSTDSSESTSVASNINSTPSKKSKRKAKSKKEATIGSPDSSSSFHKVVATSQNKRKNKKKTSKSSKRRTASSQQETDALPKENSPLVMGLSQPERSEAPSPSLSVDEDEQEDEFIRNSNKLIVMNNTDDVQEHHPIVHFLPEEKGGDGMRDSLAKPADAATSEVLSVTGRSFTDYSDSEDIKSPVVQERKGFKDSSKTIKSLGKLFRRKRTDKNDDKHEYTKDSLWSRAFSKRKGSKRRGGNEEGVVVLSVS